MRNEEVNFIQTHSGIKFFPLHPKDEEIDIDDIAHALSHICRYGGHCTNFYSVAEHSVYVAQFASNSDLALEGLLHDATEAYLQDLPRPIKNMLPAYRVIEKQLHQDLARKFDLNISKNAQAKIKEIDNRILATESYQVFDMGRVRVLDAEPYKDFTINFWSPRIAKTKFLKYFDMLWEIRRKYDWRD